MLKYYEGMWWNNKLSDDAIKICTKAYLTIIPLNNTLQPSGQSVALQSMSVGTPVLITKTIGFWDKTNMKMIKTFFLWIKTMLHYGKTN